MKNVLYLEIETAIRAVSWATAQVGQKSLQRLTIDFERKTIDNQYLTGTTKLCRLEVSSIRDSFKLIKPRFTDAGVAMFSVSGETASGVHVMPNINYGFNFEVSQDEIKFSGAHDGYPSYNISVDGKSVYDCVQGWIWQLAGDSDVKVQLTTVSLK